LRGKRKAPAASTKAPARTSAPASPTQSTPSPHHQGPREVEPGETAKAPSARRRLLHMSDAKRRNDSPRRSWIARGRKRRGRRARAASTGGEHGRRARAASTGGEHRRPARSASIGGGGGRPPTPPPMGGVGNRPATPISGRPQNMLTVTRCCPADQATYVAHGARKANNVRAREPHTACQARFRQGPNRCDNDESGSITFPQ